MRMYPRAFFLDGYNLAITWSISNCTLIAQPACNYGERKFRFFFSRFSFRFFFLYFLRPAPWLSVVRREMQQRVELYY